VSSDQPRVPLDFLFVVGTALIAATSVFTSLFPTDVPRAASTLVFAFFAPGYAITAALFPVHEPDTTSGQRGISGIERIVLSISLSVLTTGLVGVALGWFEGGIRAMPVLLVLFVVTAIALIPALIFRLRLAPSKSPMQPALVAFASVRPERFDSSDRMVLLMNVLTVIMILAALGSLSYGFVSDDTGFTEFYLLSNDEDGDAELGNYPSTLVTDRPETFIITIDNHETERVEYSLVVLVRTEVTSDGDTVVSTERRLSTQTVTLRSNESVQVPHTFSTNLTNGRVRLTYLLYEGAPPSDPSIDNAYRELHLWLPVMETSSDAIGNETDTTPENLTAVDVSAP
jgi:uncharacterized membrane protein